MSKPNKEYLSDPAVGKDAEAARPLSRKSRDPGQEEEDLVRHTDVIVAPDGGYGWVILFASFLVNVIVDGVIFSFGMLKSPLLMAFPGTEAAIPWVGSMMAGFYLLAGPVVSGLCNRYGARTITIAGALIAGASLAISAFSTSIGMLLVFFGLLGGIGFGMAYLPAIVIVGEYFEKRRAFATGLAVSGSGIGGFVFAALLEYLTAEYSWNGSLLFLAGISLNCAICGALFRPLLPVRRREEVDAQLPRSESFLQRIHDARDARINKLNSDGVEMNTRVESTYITDSNGGLSETQRMKQSAGSLHRRNSTASRKSAHSGSAHPMRPDALYAGSVQNLAEVKEYGSVQEFRKAVSKHAVDSGETSPAWGFCPDSVAVVMRQMLDLSLLKSPTFLLTCFTSFLTLAGFFIPFVYIKDLVESEAVGIGPVQGTQVLMCISVTNTIGRIIVGFISDYPRVDPIVVACSALIVGGIATCFAPFYSGLPMFITYALVFGFSISAFAALRSIILVDLFGITLLNNSFGLQMLFQGVATLIGTPTAGAIKIATGSYDSAFYFAGTLLALSGLLLWPAKLVQRWEKRTFGRKFA